MKKDTFYFTHDYNARNDVKIKKLISRHGLEGYGIFWALIEELYNNTNVLPTDYDTISFDLRVDKEKLKSVINDFDLFVFEGDFFGSLSVQSRLNERNEKSKKARDSVNKRWKDKKNNTNVLQSNYDPNTIKEKKEKEIKGKESKENKKRDFLEKQFEEIFFKWIEYKKERKESYKSLKSEEVFYNKLLELANYSPFEAEQIINQSIANNWAGIFPIKNNNLKNLNNATTTANPNDRKTGIKRLNDAASEILRQFSIDDNLSEFRE